MQIVLRSYLLIYGSGCFLGSGLNLKYFSTTGNTKRKHFLFSCNIAVNSNVKQHNITLNVCLKHENITFIYFCMNCIVICKVFFYILLYTFC